MSPNPGDRAKGLRVLLLQWGYAEMSREGFPGLDPAEFVRRFAKYNRMDPDGYGYVTRIEFEILEVL